MKTAFQYENHYELKKNRLKVLDAVDYTCAICGCEAVLVHHKDGSRDNHAPNNLLPLCQKCHSKLHSKINRVRWDGRAIEAAMMQKGIDRKELAARVGITHSAICNIINTGKTKNSTMGKIAESLQLPVEAFVLPEYGEAMDKLMERANTINPLKTAILKRLTELTTDKVLHRRFHIWLTNALREKFDVRSYYLIPPEKMTEAISFIENWRC